MKYFLFLIMMALVVSLSAARRPFKISPRLRNIICRRCFGKMYQHCAARMRMTKRSGKFEPIIRVTLSRFFASATERGRQYSALNRITFNTKFLAMFVDISYPIMRRYTHTVYMVTSDIIHLPSGNWFVRPWETLVLRGCDELWYLQYPGSHL